MSTKPRSLTSLTRDEIDEALKKANQENIIEGKVVLLTEDMYSKAYEFVNEHFLKDEPIDKAFGVQWTPEIEEIWFHAAFKLNLSLVLLNTENDDIMAIRTTTLSKRGSKIDLDVIKDPPLREVFRVVKLANEGAKFHERYDVDEAVHFLGLAVDRKYRGRGIATKLVKFQMKFLEYLGISPLYIKVEGSSNYSKRVYENLGFDVLNDFIFYDHCVNGEYVMRNTGEHKSMKSYGYKLC